MSGVLKLNNANKYKNNSLDQIITKKFKSRTTNRDKSIQRKFKETESVQKISKTSLKVIILVLGGGVEL